MLNHQLIVSAWRESFMKINEEIYNFQVIKPKVDQWIEANIIIPDSTPVYPGPYSFDFTPYMREIVNHIHPSDPTRFVSIMKDGQSGFTTALVIGGILYLISEAPDGILFTAADIQLASKTIEERLDPVIRSSNLDHLIRPNVIKKTNNRTGDTSKKKEFAGGTLTALGTNSANSFRMFSAKYILADDYDTAPKEIGKEGSPKAVMKTRQNSFGEKAKTFFISTPTVTQTSNIYEQYLLGTQKKWHWPCPACGNYFPVEWQTVQEDGSYAGVIWKLDDHKKLIPETVLYKTQCCGHLIEEKEKYDLNLLGKWIATAAVSEERRHESYQKNFIYNPPGFDGWIVGVEEWLQACPPGEKVVVKLLKTFSNLRLGMPFAETGESPKVNDLMNNTRTYKPGIVPDSTSESDGNGTIIMLTLACDLNGIMEKDNEDVRLDWELLAHSSTGVTYSVDHGSIGTFKRARDRSRKEKEEDMVRDRWTLTHNVKFSVWKTFEEVIRQEYPLESGGSMNVSLTVVDTGFGEKLAMQFIKSFTDGTYIYGVKGRIENDYRKIQRDTTPVIRSREHPGHLYIVEVNQIKDDLAQMMKLREGEDGTQPSGYMNYPQPTDGKYTMKSYFSHYEGERRTEVVKDDQVIGYKWEKKNNQVQNHFWDVRIYGLVAPLIYLDIFKRSKSAFKNYTWEDFVLLVTAQ
ncbi:MAG TPA: terminase gpA endonuclease subunit [Pedobacter sp.]|uniref:terminase gpA endonuclease subunit n=1 Tax=Pedobacter sp. TaxID=1411316 RepID=UPI002CADA7B1|nr:terminase gpA endonuclease subunit [Pedobacter sp.]HMI01619.1 terminase gpA endonuclease subunit [Pedobacter sp.]